MGALLGKGPRNAKKPKGKKAKKPAETMQGRRRRVLNVKQAHNRWRADIGVFCTAYLERERSTCWPAGSGALLACSSFGLHSLI